MRLKISIIVIITLFICGCKNSTDEVANKTTIRFSESIKPETVFPPLISNVTEAHIVSQVHDAMLKVDAVTMELKGELCKNWIINTDQDRISFIIRDSVFFHDDTCFNSFEDRMLTAHDVKATLEYIIYIRVKRELPLGLLSQINGVDQQLETNSSKPLRIGGIQVKNMKTVVINLSEPNPAFLYTLVDPFTVILPEEGLDVYGEDCKIGCGAYMFDTTADMKDSVVLVKNPDYYQRDKKGQRLPYLDKITVIYETVPQKSLRMLAEGRIDFILTMQQAHVKQFLKQNIDLFESDTPKLVLQQAKGLEDSELFLLRKGKVKGLSFNEANQLNLDQTMLED